MIPDTWEPVTCTLASSEVIVFDVYNSVQDDHDETGQVYEMFVRAVGK